LRGQDVVTLLAAVALVWGAVRARAGSLAGHIVWLAVTLYVAYTYLMYVVAPYNDALLLYIAAIGLATYGLLNGLFRLERTRWPWPSPTSPSGVAWFLIVVGTLFASLWLVDILSVWPGGIPDSLFVYDIPSIGARPRPRDRAAAAAPHRGAAAPWPPVAPVLAAIVLVKTLTLGLALLSMNAFVAASTGTLDPAEPVLWTLVIAAALAWLVLGARRMRPAPSPWLRPTVW
jgi:hypothetical protein